MVDPRLLDGLAGSRVLAFEAVHDYFFMTLDRAWVCLNNTLTGEASVAERANAIVGTEVTDVEYRHDEFLAFRFSNGANLTMSLRPEDYYCPEAAVIAYRNGRRTVRTIVID